MLSRHLHQAFLVPALLFASWVAFSGLSQRAAMAQQSEGLSILDQLGSFGPGVGGQGNEIELSGKFQLEENSREGRLVIKADITDGWHIYSLSQKPGGPQKSELKLAESDQYQLIGPFQPSKRPHIERYEFWPNLDVEEHHESLGWSAPIRIAGGIDAQQLELTATFSGQVCKEGVCIPIDPPREIKATFDGYFKPVPPTESFRPPRSHLTFSGSAAAASAAPGSRVQLSIQAVPDPGWHVYAYGRTDPQLVNKPTLVLLDLPAGWQAGPVQASVEPSEEETGLEAQPISRYHEEPVTWRIDVAIPPNAEPGKYTIAGQIGYQTCSEAQCDAPLASKFSTQLEIGTATGTQPAGFAFVQQGSYNDIAETLKLLPELKPLPAANGLAGAAESGTLDLDRLETQSTKKEYSLVAVMLMAFGGGFILNFMPCVLPVIGLKLMSFLQQSGESRGRIFALNVWYVAGLMSVFMVLATLAVFMGLGWGAQFSSSTFTIILSAVVFSFALSFLGVWEVPLPGFVGSGTVGDLATKEGASGAFFKGVLTTILATPCSAPLLGTALTWFIGQRPLVAYVGFGCVGLGMGSPYLLIGAFPKLIAFLPKPGAWMETFKQAMGFVLLGTVVFLLSFLEISLVVPTVAFTMGLWAALWWVGRISVTAPTQAKLRGWLAATAFAVAIGLFSFTELTRIMEGRFERAVDRTIAARMAEGGGTVVAAQAAPAKDSHELPWEPFSLARLQQLTDTGHTVLVDFTADWCWTCKTNERVALNRQETREFVDRNGIVTLVADKTHANPDADTLLDSLGNRAKSIPYYAIFPAGRPNQPLLLDGLFPSPKPILDALEKAGPSQAAAEGNRPVMARGGRSAGDGKPG